MKHTWNDAEDIAMELMALQPELDPLKVRFTDLHRMVVDLPTFGDDPGGSTERALEAIQMAWLDEWQDDE